MKFGVGWFPTGPASDMVERAVLAEKLGFDAFWVADTHLIWREVWVLLGAMAARTSRIEIGPGVTHPIVRHPSLIAAAIATLAELAPGRVNLGIGIGDSGPANMGLPRATLKQLETAIRDIKSLLRGEPMVAGETEFRLAYAKGDGVPIYVAGASDRTHRMAGRVAEGVFVAGAVDELRTSVATVRDGEQAAGRSPHSTQVVLFTTSSIDPDPQVARAAVRQVVARKSVVSLGIESRRGTLDPADLEPLERLRQAYDTHHHMEALYNELVLDRWVDRFSLAGTPEQVLARCRQAAVDGADQLSIVFNGPDLEEQLRRFAEAVIVPMRAGGNEPLPQPLP
jgi:5,10-methylenetetrahydromethanopterin reductase